MTSGMEIVDDRVHCAVLVDADPRRLGHRVIAAETDEGVAIVDKTPQLAVITVHAQDDRPIREVEPACSVGEGAARGGGLLRGRVQNAVMRATERLDMRV